MAQGNIYRPIYPGTTTPKMCGSATAGSSAKFAKEDHVHPNPFGSFLTTNRFSLDNISLNSGAGTWGNITITKSGWTPIAVSGVITEAASSGGTGGTYLTYQKWIINGNTFQYSVRNTGTGTIKVRIVCDILYYRN